MWRVARFLAPGVGVLMLCSIALAQAQPRYAAASEPEAEDGHAAIVWVGTVATNIFYIPTKMAYATVGGLVGAIAWVLTGADTDAANTIWTPTVRGNWVVTPGMLDGQEELHFIGP